MSLPSALASRRRPATAPNPFVAAATRWLDHLQRHCIFRPQRPSRWSLARATRRMHDMPEVWIDFVSADTGQPVRLHALWHAHADPSAPVLLFLHGAQHDLTGSIERIRHMRHLGFSVLAVDYRGFGQSGPSLPSEVSAYEDARAAWHWLSQQHPHATRYIFGHSLGGAIAVHLAAEVVDAHGLIVDSSFTCLPDVVATFRWGWPPLLRLLTHRFDAAEKMRHVRAPVLVVHGEADRLIPHSLGLALWQQAAGRKHFVLVEGGSHHNTHATGQHQYRLALHELFGLPMSPTTSTETRWPNAA